MGLFGGGSSVELPPVPTFYNNPYVLPAISQGLSTGQSFVNQDGSLSPSLQEAISTNPQVSQLAIDALKSQLAPSLRQSTQDITNQLEANNQLTGSTTGNQLENLQADYLSQITSAGLQAAMSDINRALGSRIQLANIGAGLIGTAGNQALTDQSQHNTFNLENYQNEVAKTLAGQKQQTGGLLGALTGGLGGILTGAPLGLPGMIAGGLTGAAAGGFGPAGTGGAFLTAGAGVQGARLATPSPNVPTANGGLYNSNTGESISMVNPYGQQGGLWPNLYNGLQLAA